MVFFDLRFLIEIRFPDDIGHFGFDDLKTVLFQIPLDLMVGARMEIQEIFAYNQNLRFGVTSIIVYLIHNLNGFFKAFFSPSDAGMSQTIYHLIKCPLKGSIGTSSRFFIRTDLSQQLFQCINHGKGKGNADGG